MRDKKYDLKDSTYKICVVGGGLGNSTIEVLEIHDASNKLLKVMPQKALEKYGNTNPFLKWSEVEVARWIGTIGYGGIWVCACMC